MCGYQICVLEPGYSADLLVVSDNPADDLAKNDIVEKMKDIGLKHVKFNFNTDGSKVLNLYDYSKE